MAWRKDGIVGDKIIRHRGRLYKLATVRDSSTYQGMTQVKRKAQQWAGKTGKVLRLHNTYSFAVYLPYSGAERPKGR